MTEYLTREIAAERAGRSLTNLEAAMLQFVGLGRAGQPRLTVDHQSFDLDNDGRPWRRERAEWYCAMLAIALARMVSRAPHPVADLSALTGSPEAELDRLQHEAQIAGLGRPVTDLVYRLNAAITALRSRPVGKVWQPIDTMLDRRRVLLWWQPLSCAIIGTVEDGTLRRGDGGTTQNEIANWGRFFPFWHPLPDGPEGVP
ncbi:hypothetical protein [Pseudogemmobacter humi]|uniref:Uncharacterized protein n=1 Tax=Pseudogemmobacter humi TaxID=2483812 RepID=A0A3P5XI92_9RHOB|nr:hypothetical protein [Pseudogemmobacter humi]VDC28237.1 hypothetical protein XINFAN_02013 [Pseudogemmobacter humi]